MYYCSFRAVCGFAAAVATDTTTPLHKIILVGPSCMWRWAGVVVCFCLFLSG